MRPPSPPTARPPRPLTAPRAGLAALTAAVLLSGCGGSSGGSVADPIPDQTSSTSAPSPEATPEPSPEASPVVTEPADGTDLPGGLLMVGDKSVYLDGFFGVRVPEGWSATLAEVPLLSTTPPGGETELDASALSQSLVLNPEASPRGATLSLVHYEHSDSVPDLDRFTPAIVDLLSGDGSTIGGSSEVTIGKQPGRLHQVTSASGANGVMVTLRAGDEYFFILSLAADTSYAGDVGDMLASISMVPEALHS
ncbi:MAG: hypothetical protein OSB43_00185 [Nocardioides sp.]|uniref:hypothetical protein n=1 Tax=Nocardioides sp. TaxID=35761 RepID=UPI002385A99B|nr:hypothetical protein [Nocardioides sp.]MDE0774676.1 hypothetical protein [Nocardioides sp.]